MLGLTGRDTPVKHAEKGVNVQVFSDLKRLIWVDVANPIESLDAETWIAEAGASKDLIDQLYAFGGMMLGEVASRTSALDSKASGILNWSLAVMVVLMAGSPLWISTNSWLVVFGVAVCILGLVLLRSCLDWR